MRSYNYPGYSKMIVDELLSKERNRVKRAMRWL